MVAAAASVAAEVSQAATGTKPRVGGKAKAIAVPGTATAAWDERTRVPSPRWSDQEPRALPRKARHRTRQNCGSRFLPNRWERLLVEGKSAARAYSDLRRLGSS